MSGLGAQKRALDGGMAQVHATFAEAGSLRVRKGSILEPIPIPESGVELAHIEGEGGVLYSYEKEAMVYLSDSAVIVWRLCDGKRTVKEITDLLASTYPDEAEKISTDVSDVIEHLMQEGVVSLANATPKAAINSDSDTLASDARRAFQENQEKHFGLNRCRVTYINLEDRRERRAQIESELNKLRCTNRERFPAIVAGHGGLGCSLSHMAVLLRALQESADLTMICEDDCQFLVQRAQIDEILESFWASKEMDVLCLAYTSGETSRFIKYNELLSRGYELQTSCCYVVKHRAISAVISSGTLESISRFLSGEKYERYAFDQVWKPLQYNLCFAVPTVKVAKQRKSYSDIENMVVDYGC